MRNRALAVASLISVCLPLSILWANGVNERVIEVANVEELWKAESIINSKTLDESIRIVVILSPNSYHLQESFSIERSNVSIVGAPGVKFVLGEYVNMPVIAVGSQKAYLTGEDVIENITIRGVEIDGNRKRQDSETMTKKPWIRNNGIDIRAVRELSVSSVISKSNRSGGLVISWKSSDIRVRDSHFADNHFDGVAYYDCIRIYTTSCSMSDNQFAGISLDNAVKKSSFVDCVVEGNGMVGVFARNSDGLKFDNCVVSNSRDWAVFIAHDEKNQGVHNATFSHCRMLDNQGGLFMASVDERQSSRIYVVESHFEGNERAGRKNIQTSGSRIFMALPEIAEKSHPLEASF